MKINFISLGCARNLVDTEVMLGIVLKAGFEITPSINEANYIVINTCGFLEASRKEACDTIAETIQEKQKDAKLIVAGCMVQKHQEILKEKFPEIHYFLGSGDVDQILKALQALEPGIAVTDAKSFLQKGEVPRLVSTPPHYAYLKIAEGCKKQCAFCIIPKIKGPLKSKSIEQVLKEFRALLDQGVFEVILIAQDLGDYGKDRREKGALATLLKEILKIKRPFWLRLLYLYPDEIDDDIIAILESDDRVCSYVDMPIQHINDSVLKRMHRKTNKAQIIDIIEKLRKRLPNMIIRTSLMVGFPGETEKQFQELKEFIQQYPLDHVGIFQFSKEKEAYAAKLPDQISSDIKQKRFEVLATLQLKMVRRRNKRFIGKRFPVIVEGYHVDSPHLMRGRFQGQCPDIDGEVIINDGRLVDEFSTLYEVKMTDVIDYDLIGTVTKKLNIHQRSLSHV